MIARAAIVSLLLLGAVLVPPARAQIPLQALVEIDYLLGFVKGSGCSFHRNGTWHDALAAEAHLRAKYEALALADRINTAEDFILLVAAKSSFSGQAYEVRCNAGSAITSEQWLREELERFRAIKKKPASSVEPSRPGRGGVVRARLA